ncbi:cupin-like domain-containing protein [Asticcacaulis sp. EMRT-3]|uniref:cupin-like domain-containing protein n=1 Tax=Asticcacaulis sp. EMRT-3 TaxID=3040349 RepID=UPI0024AF8056|nr:cupin-like domain-containing protein [Asticcacaulis sp. EMRT-3]MDI7774947.1 cupin-like domain-containing protein [Asticcacaulis sp. EMRT-3]
MTTPVREISGFDRADTARFRAEIVAACQPVILRGLVADWPLVQAEAALGDYLTPFAVAGQTEIFVGAPAIAGKYYYAEGLSGFNFERRRLALAEALTLTTTPRADAASPSVYVGSLPMDDLLPGLAQANPMGLAGGAGRLWLGHAANVSPHYDGYDNLACVIAGRRRFTLYAPDTISRLYVGPIDHTMAGQPVSLAAAADPPEPDRYPLFEAVRAQALSAELEAGDALYLPKLWWHKVESLAPVNGLVNYWWDATASGPDAPNTAMLLAMIAIAERPPAERHAWRAFFDHYVFRPEGHPLAHLPPEQHGLLGPLKDNYGKIRAFVMHRLRGG